ncbi:hypothetical protein F4779DRAFT_638995 [Xylariaceae sp. FL0662B]|nr:hypothetical protein F4779DRAFT_638995 [Xylariaceae sp. FL0662B]
MFAQEGWRRAGAMNLALVSILGTLLLIILLISITHIDSPLQRATIFHEGICDDTAKINLALHLVINLVSSAVLASSNFFMQVLSAPSRKEIDEAHLYLRSLDIGLPSVKNIRFMSRFKLICWLVFFLSSFPVHLLFNSSVFETNYQGADWHLTIATEAFTHGTTFFAPGASLAPAGAPSPAYKFLPATWHDPYLGGYGKAVDLVDEASSWAYLKPQECLAEYRACKPRKQYRDVVVVVESGTNDPTGWKRSEIFDFDPTGNLSNIWDPHVPPGSINPLWYSTQCATQIGMRLFGKKPGACYHSCRNVLGLNVKELAVNEAIPPDTNWTLKFQHKPWYLPADIVKELGYNESFDNLNVKHCLAMPLLKPCKLGLSNTLLLVVVICVFVKAITCAVVIWRLSDLSLVTPGDAIESFILKPDTRTVGLGTLDIVDSQRLEYAPRKSWTLDVDRELSPLIRPRGWRRSNHRLWRTIPRAAWSRTYFLLFVAMVALSTFLGLSLASSGNNLTTPFGHSDEALVSDVANGSGYLGLLLWANVPQVFVTFCYFSYNSFFTRMVVEQEWNEFSLSHKPLRVSHPKGNQVSTYRLQLPYKYSIPLFGVSALLHWLIGAVWHIRRIHSRSGSFTACCSDTVCRQLCPGAITPVLQSEKAQGKDGGWGV